jgi:hypothetical protein
LKVWAKLLDPEDTREYDTPPEVTHILRDNSSSEEGSFFTNNIDLIMYFEVKKVIVNRDQGKHKLNKETITTNTPSELSVLTVIITTTKDDSKIAL